MERLTKKDGANRNIIEVKRYSDEDWTIVENTKYRTISFHSKAIDKLAEFEDFMEESKIKDLDILKSVIELGIKDRQVMQRYLKMWKGLKEYIDTRLSDYRFEGHIVSPETQELSAIINKMQELAKEMKYE